MAHSGIPKDPSVRARRNKASTRAVLHVVPEGEAEIPDLPDDGSEWHPLTEAWWNDIFSSPMAAEWDDSDIHGLWILAVLVDQFWHEPSTKLAAEIRLQRVPFGLTPIDRRRLEWEIDRGEEASDGTRTRRNERGPQAGVPAEEGADDPRRNLA